MIDTGNTVYIQQRLVENANNFFDSLLRYYPYELTREAERIFLDRYIVSNFMLNNMLTGNRQAADWNAQEWLYFSELLARLLSEMNPHWDADRLRARSKGCCCTV